MTRLIALDTYKKVKTTGGWIAASGDHKTIKVGKDWLERKILPQTLDEFLSEYTFDDSERLYREYLNAKKTEPPEPIILTVPEANMLVHDLKILAGYRRSASEDTLANNGLTPKESDFLTRLQHFLGRDD